LGRCSAYFNNVEGLVNGTLDIEGEASVDLSGDFAGNDLEDLFAKFNEEAIKGRVNLFIHVFALFTMSNNFLIF
jgi:hypothetical protein